jgi:hypothetical protein
MDVRLVVPSVIVDQLEDQSYKSQAHADRAKSNRARDAQTRSVGATFWANRRVDSRIMAGSIPG